MLALSVLPLLNLLCTSFYNVTWSGGQATWTPVGFAHYAALPGDPLFRAGLGNTVIFALVRRRRADGARLRARSAVQPRRRAAACSTARSSSCRS